AQRHSAEQRAHQRALAAAIRPNDRGDLSTRNGQAHVCQSITLLPRIPDADVGEFHHVRRRSVTRKNGTPSIAVTAPSGSSAGGSATRATRSAATTSTAPISALASRR